jgi:hypothetical protein
MVPLTGRLCLGSLCSTHMASILVSGSRGSVSGEEGDRPLVRADTQTSSTNEAPKVTHLATATLLAVAPVPN